MAEVGDADGFGDFTFATATVDPNPKINGGARVSAVSDDDWGDFVTTDTAAPQVKAQPFDPFGFSNVANGPPPPTRPESAPIRAGTEPEKTDKTRWEKPRGALPLSLFGEELEEEDESNLSKSEGFVKKETNLNAKSVGINDLIANLYGQNPKVAVENGSDSNSGSGGSDSAGKGMNFSANALDLKFDDLIPNGNGKLGGLDWGSNGLDLKFEGVDSNSNASGVKLSLEEGNGDFDEDDDDDDDGGWEFKTAESEVPPASNENLKEQGVVEVAGPKVESNMNTYIHPGIQVDERQQENPGGTGFSWGFGIDAPQVNNVHVPSRGFSHGNGEWGFSFDFNPSPVPQHSFFADIHSMSTQNNAGNVSNASPVGGNMWGFKDALSETESNHKLEEAKPVIPAGLEQHSLDGVSAHGHNDFFAGSDGISQKSHENNFAFPLIPNSGMKDYVIPDSYSSGKKDDIAKELSFSPANDHAELDDDCWEFKDAFSESESKLEHNEVTLDNKRQALPLSIFGDEELETDDSSITQGISTPTAAPLQINTARGPPSNVSITDLISSLYSEVDQNTNTIHAPNATENHVHPAPKMLKSDFGDNDFDDDSWEFKDAVSTDQDRTSVTNLEYSSQDSLAKVELDNFVDFFCKLKYESYLLAFNHLDNKKKAQSSAVLSGEDTTSEALEEEIQKLYYELHQDGMIPDQSQSGNPSQRNPNLNEVHKALQDPQFQVLESEFQLSERLSLAEEDLRSAIELSRHAASTLKILRLGSPEEQSNYISAWSQIASICAQELKHGSLIWMHSIEKNVQTQILSDPQGKQYILALGEIYRVVLVVGASAKLYKPWTLLHSSDCSSLLALLNECSTLWSSSGLCEALKSFADEIDFKYDGTINELLDSMTYTQQLDASALRNHVVNGQQPICSLSLLTAGVVPGIKMVTWNGKQYLLTLANLWINLISPDPPQLPHFSYS